MIGDDRPSNLGDKTAKKNSDCSKTDGRLARPAQLLAGYNIMDSTFC